MAEVGPTRAAIYWRNATPVNILDNLADKPYWHSQNAHFKIDPLISSFNEIRLTLSFTTAWQPIALKDVEDKNSLILLRYFLS